MGKYCAPGGTLAISDGWAEHRARGSLGGTDYLDGYGTPIRAMAAGTVVMVDSNPDGSGGRMITIRHADGNSTEVLHADRWIVSRGQAVSPGQIIGYSGGSGFGADRYYGAHTHAHEVSATGIRRDVQPHVQHVHPLTSSPAGGGTSPISNRGDTDMGMDLIRHPNGTINFSDELGSENAGDYRTADIGVEEFLSALQRVYGPVDQLTAREFDIAAAIAQRRWAAKADSIANLVIAKLGGSVKATVDPAPLVAALKEAVLKLPVGATPAQNAAAVEAALLDNLAAIPKAVADENARRLQS
ncbi:M23 family metallopeptidase [Agromyces badenianii]|uniref:M23 family metallopeptidase n=1 Tax=Agromyces badenianii TaxID=2080742 RepID=UPI00140463F1|nr:M23 family metallopeptidase [Agromyces badenianii]